jgi:tetratricopeptide (TPR) repeat protein
VAKRYQNADLVFTEARHSLGRDRETRERFDRVVKQDPKDTSAFSALMMVCSQYLFDFNCAFRAAQNYAKLANSPMDPDDYLDLAEIAILAGRNETAREWLAGALRQPEIPVKEESLVYFYQLWLGMRQGQADELSRDFQAWQRATQQFRVTDGELNWIFDGVRKALKDERMGDKQRQLLLAMMDALEDNRRPLPSWPESGVL